MLFSLFCCAFIVSLTVTVVLIRSAHLHARFSMDSDLSGPQKFHVRPTPRVGGVPVLGGLLAALTMGWLRMGDGVSLFVVLLCAGLPVFLAGLVEDLTKRVRPLYRLIFAFASAGLAAWWGGGDLVQPRRAKG